MDIRKDTGLWLPTSVKEMKARGWDAVDVVLFSGDAYVDHPSFGAAVIGRTLESAGYRVAIVPQPNWRDDLRDFRKFGTPRLFFGVSAGAMDSMVNHYTAARRLRSDDAYTPGGKHGMTTGLPYNCICRDIAQTISRCAHCCRRNRSINAQAVAITTIGRTAYVRQYWPMRL